MKNKMRIVAATLAVATIMAPSVKAVSNITYNFAHGQRYRIMIDGDTYAVPDSVTYENGYIYDMTKYKNFLEKQAAKSEALTYENGILTYNGGVCSSSISKESNPLMDDKKGIFNTSINEQLLTDYFEYYIIMNKRADQLQKYQDKLATATTEEDIFECNVKINRFTEDIQRMSVINAPVKATRAIGSIPYLAESYTITDAIPQGTEEVDTAVNVKYYLNSLIMRDLRLYSIKYSINDGKYKMIPNYKNSVYSYSVRLPDSTPDNAIIKTQSLGTMQETMRLNNMAGYENMGITITDSTIKLNNGYGIAKVKVEFDVSPYVDSETYLENPTREYIVTFTNKDYIKGDLDKNGIINGTDASIALDIYNKDIATEENLLIGDMDNNGIINGTDASMILDIYNKVL